MASCLLQFGAFTGGCCSPVRGGGGGEVRAGGDKRACVLAPLAPAPPRLGLCLLVPLRTPGALGAGSVLWRSPPGHPRVSRCLLRLEGTAWQSSGGLSGPRETGLAPLRAERPLPGAPDAPVP